MECKKGNRIMKQALFQPVVLKGKSRHGKNRIEQHGNQWFVEEFGKFNGADAMLLRSERKTFKLGDNMIRDGRWVLLKNDPNFLYFW